MSWLIWIFVALFGLFVFWQAEQPDCSTSPDAEGCAARSPATVDVISGIGWETIIVGEIRGVIVPAHDAGSLVYGTRPEIPEEDYWTPTRADVKAAEAAIAAEQGDLEHNRQYAGFTEDGERHVFVNGFCESFSADWTREPVHVDDGGDCFFTAIYKVDRDILEMFRFNGQG